MPELFVKERSEPATTVRLQGARLSIGRAPDNDLQLDDRPVSRYHALIFHRDDQWHVNDLGSNNGTLVNGEQVVSAALKHGDEIRIGGVVLVLHLEPEEKPQTGETSDATPLSEITQTISLDDIGRFYSLQRAATESLSQKDRRLHYLLAIAELAVSARSIPLLFEGLVQSLRRTLDASRVVPILQDAHDLLRAYSDSSQQFVDRLADLRVDVSLIERCHREGIAAVGERADPALHVACVPVRIGVRNLGLIYCERSGPLAAFDDEDLRYLLAGSSLTGVAIENIRYRQQVTWRARSLDRLLAQHYDMVGRSEPMLGVFEFIRKVAPTDAGVLICGESGTGKEMAARAIHLQSERSDGPLEVVNCGAVPVTLLESELFGHVKGSFTGAIADKPGRFELADDGTLFLDEVVELPPPCQTKLLRALEEGKVRRIGDTSDQSVDVRLIAATNRDPAEAVGSGRLREDLFYRLDRLRLVMPPLRDRGQDVEILAEHFLAQLSRSLRRPVEAFDPSVLTVFRAYHWPGNVRELRNVVERMLILAEGPVLGPELIPEDIRKAPSRASEASVPPLEQMEREHVERALRASGGNKKRAAEMLGINRSTLYAKLKKYAIET